MHPYCVYVFDSSTANEAALAVKEGHYQSIIDYHSTKHQHKQVPPPNMSGSQPHMHNQAIQPPPPQQMVGGPPMGAYHPPHPPHHHLSPPQSMVNMPPAPNMQQQQNLSPQKMRERESKLNRLGQLAQLTTQPPPNMAVSQQRPMPPQHQIPHQQQPPPSQQQQQPPPPPPHQQQIHIKSEPQQQPLDPLSSMAAMTECPTMDNYGHTVHHHPPPS